MIIAYKNKNNDGFTVIEVIICLAITGILFTLALPSVSHMLSSNQQTSVLHTLFTNLSLARTKAIVSQQHILLCKSSNGQQCTNTSKWSDGWLIFADIDNNKQINNGEYVIHVQQALPDYMELSYRGFGSINYFRYY